MRIGFTYDLRNDYLAAGYSELDTAEFDRPDTIDAIESALMALGHDVVRIGHVRQLTKRLAAGERWDLVFNICEGLSGFGREAQVPALLDAWDIPYTFSDPLVSALTLHKAHSKSVVRSHGLATPDWALVERGTDASRVDLPFPVFAKPVAEGTGKGVTGASRVQNLPELVRVCARLLREFDQPVLVERFLPGREFTVGITGTGSQAVAVGTAEIGLRAQADAQVYSYHNKEFCEELVDYILCRDAAITEPVEALALKAWEVLGCRDAGRVDIRLDEHGTLHFLEVNPLAGLHPEHSDLPIICTLVGIEYRELIDRILRSARLRVAVTDAARSRSVA